MGRIRSVFTALNPLVFIAGVVFITFAISVNILIGIAFWADLECGRLPTYEDGPGCSHYSFSPAVHFLILGFFVVLSISFNVLSALSYVTWHRNRHAKRRNRNSKRLVAWSLLGLSALFAVIGLLHAVLGMLPS